MGRTSGGDDIREDYIIIVVSEIASDGTTVFDSK
jgi:hypothetical protein